MVAPVEGSTSPTESLEATAGGMAQTTDEAGVLWGTLEDASTVDGPDDEGGEGQVEEHLAGL